MSTLEEFLYDDVDSIGFTSNRELAEAVLDLKGAPLSLAEYAPMHSMYEDDSRELLLMAGRQVSKSTSLMVKLLTKAATTPFYSQLYVCPLKDQTSRFSNLYIADTIKFSPALKTYFLKKGGGDQIQNVHLRSFANGSAMHFQYCMFSADRVRGISADSVLIDESENPSTLVYAITSSKSSSKDPLDRELKTLDSLQVGDLVLSYDQQFNFSFKPVTKIMRKPDKVLYRVHLENGAHLDVTSNHKLETPAGLEYLVSAILQNPNRDWRVRYVDPLGVQTRRAAITRHTTRRRLLNTVIKDLGVVQSFSKYKTRKLCLAQIQNLRELSHPTSGYKYQRRIWFKNLQVSNQVGPCLIGSSQKNICPSKKSRAHKKYKNSHPSLARSINTGRLGLLVYGRRVDLHKNLRLAHRRVLTHRKRANSRLFSGPGLGCNGSTHQEKDGRLLPLHIFLDRSKSKIPHSNPAVRYIGYGVQMPELAKYKRGDVLYLRKDMGGPVLEPRNSLLGGMREGGQETVQQTILRDSTCQNYEGRIREGAQQTTQDEAPSCREYAQTNVGSSLPGAAFGVSTSLERSTGKTNSRRYPVSEMRNTIPPGRSSAILLPRMPQRGDSRNKGPFPRKASGFPRRPHPLLYLPESFYAEEFQNEVLLKGLRTEGGTTSTEVGPSRSDAGEGVRGVPRYIQGNRQPTEVLQSEMQYSQAKQTAGFTPKGLDSLEIEDLLVTKVECLGLQPCMDIEVADNFTFVGNGFLSSNCQDMIMDVLPIILSTMKASKYRKSMYSGTPKTFDNTIEGLWKSSTRYEWAMKCSHCGFWAIPTEEYVEAMIDVTRPPKEGIVCPRTACRKPLDITTGEWICMGDPKALMKGYHLPQIIFPHNVCNKVGWEDFCRDYEGINDDPNARYSRRQIYNEVFGLSYDIGGRIITQRELEECTDETQVMYANYSAVEAAGMTLTYGGVDWGAGGTKSFTVVVILASDAYNRLRVVYARKYPVGDPTQQIADVLEIFRRFRVVRIGADYGNGWVYNQYIRNALGIDKVNVFQYVASKLFMAVNRQGGHMVVDRTNIMNLVLMELKQKKFVFPKLSVAQPFFDDILSVYEEELQLPSGQRKVFKHSYDQPDDFMHALVYGSLACKMYNGDPALDLANLPTIYPTEHEMQNGLPPTGMDQAESSEADDTVW